ncbi:hypothetical protein L1987_51923 [Smallanthus sonchifolius]|uniref:Uncharacterized protein n=1 Tax=Smallanthus sonchifolius TaxID=185202 RepID=A0ACB9ES04_9ASTR|nr:hypothetical protein L1987_51923 [Smallanthus sonchifolius]
MKQLNLIQMEQVSPNNRHIINDEDGENNPQEKAELNCETGYPEGKKDFVAPAVGMEFESYDDAYNYYNCYARESGFRVRVHKSIKKMVQSDSDAEGRTIKLYKALVIDSRGNNGNSHSSGQELGSSSVHHHPDQLNLKKAQYVGIS